MPPDREKKCRTHFYGGTDSTGFTIDSIAPIRLGARARCILPAGYFAVRTIVSPSGASATVIPQVRASSPV
jgi:hypothetical protein